MLRSCSKWKACSLITAKPFNSFNEFAWGSCRGANGSMPLAQLKSIAELPLRPLIHWKTAFTVLERLMPGQTETLWIGERMVTVSNSCSFCCTSNLGSPQLPAKALHTAAWSSGGKSGCQKLIHFSPTSFRCACVNGKICRAQSVTCFDLASHSSSNVMCARSLWVLPALMGWQK